LRQQHRPFRLPQAGRQCRPAPSCRVQFCSGA
jgi:hypothetical protein